MNCYATITDLAARVSDAGSYVAQSLAILAAVSREIDAHCGRGFFTRIESRDFDVLHCGRVAIDDCLGLTGAGADSEGDETWDGEAWVEGTDYSLEPRNSWPRRMFVPMFNGRYSLSVRNRYLRLTGTWGYSDGESADPWREPVGGNATVATETGTTLTLSAAGVQAGMTLLVENEQMFVIAVAEDGLSATVRRGLNGTRAAAHAAKAGYRALYPPVVIDVAANVAAQRFKSLNPVDFKSERIGDYSYERFGGGALEQYLGIEISRLGGAGLVAY